MTDLGACAHCGRPVIDAIMRKSGKAIMLDPEPQAAGNLQLVELGQVAQFIPTEWRDPKSRWFVPTGERYVSHMVTCPQNARTADPAAKAFIAGVDRRLEEARS